MDFHIWALVLFSALLHASWNALVKNSSTPHLAITMQSFFMGAICAFFIPFLPLPKPETYPILVATTVVHITYNLVLASAYKIGDFGLVYPIARGIAPLIILVLSFLLFSEAPSLQELIAIALIIIGITSLALRKTHDTAGLRNLKATAAALVTGAFIALYTTLDGWGARINQNPHSFIVWLSFITAISVSPFLFLQRRSLLQHTTQTKLSQNIIFRTAIGAIFSLTSYWIVVWALSQSPMAPVSALRETSIIVATIISALIFKEPFGITRIAATVLVATGVVIMGLNTS